MKRKIVYWIYWPEPKRIETIKLDYLKALQCKGYEITIISTQRELNLAEQENQHGIMIYRFPFLQALSNKDPTLISDITTKLRQLKQTLKPDLYHLSLGDAGVIFHLLTEMAFPAPALLGLHGLLNTDVQGNGAIKKLLSKSDQIVGCTNAVIDAAVAIQPNIMHKTSVIYNSASFPTIRPTELPCQPPILLCIGRHTHEKGFDIAIQAFAKAKQSLPALQMLIAGDGPQTNTLKQLVIDLQLQSAITFLGWIDNREIPSLINRGSLVLMPSRREAFGIVALKSALMGRPVIASAIGGLPEVIEDNQSGIIVQENTPAAFSEAMISLLSQPEKLKSMGRYARQRAFKQFDFDNHVESYDQLYLSMLTNLS